MRTQKHRILRPLAMQTLVLLLLHLLPLKHALSQAESKRQFEKFTLEGSPAYVPLFTSGSINASLSRVNHLFIVIHGSEFGAREMFDSFFETLEKQPHFDEVNDSILIVSPQFYSTEGIHGEPCVPSLAIWKNEWWRYGSRNSSYMDENGEKFQLNKGTFDVLDDLIVQVMSRATNLITVNLFGFSAGAQLVQRYALYGSSSDTIASSVEFNYIVSSPSTFMYLSGLRPTRPYNVNRPIKFHTPNDIPGYDDFAYGMANIDGENRSGGEISGYFLSTGKRESEVIERFRSRHVHYFIGEKDTIFSGFDKRPEAMAQGDSRIFRSIAFYEHISEHFGGKLSHTFNQVEGVGHDLKGILKSDQFTGLVELRIFKHGKDIR